MSENNIHTLCEMSDTWLLGLGDGKLFQLHLLTNHLFAFKSMYK